MPEQHEMTRRALIAGTGAIVSCAALGLAIVPSVDAAQPETLADRIDRLGSELSAALTEYDGGDWRLIIGADHVLMQPRTMPGSARARSEIHLANYRSTLRELDPTITGWSVAYDVNTGAFHYLMAERKSRG